MKLRKVPANSIFVDYEVVISASYNEDRIFFKCVVSAVVLTTKPDVSAPGVLKHSGSSLHIL